MKDELRAHLPRLAELIECDGAGLWLDGEWIATGSTPAIDEIGPVLLMLGRQGIRILWDTNELRAHHGLVQSITRVAGVLAIPLSAQAPDFLLLFRDEEALGHAPPWTDADRSVADAIKRTFASSR